MKFKRSAIVSIATLTSIVLTVSPVLAHGDVVVTGSGWGHGLGMSQYGALGQALEGKTAEEILSHYYSGSSIVDITTAIPGSWLLTEPEPLWVNLLAKRTSVQITPKGGSLFACQNEPNGLLLKLGHTSQWVYELETSLVDTGHFTGIPDNVFDSETKAAVVAYQTDNALDIDGIVGPQTRGSLWPVDGDGENCVLETPLTIDTTYTIVANDDGTCLFGDAPVAGNCVGSVRDLSHDARVAITGKVYAGKTTEFAHGTLRIRSRSAGTIHLVNQVGIEDYVAGIAEMPLSDKWLDEALRAQAIAARSYALNRAEGRGPESELSDTTKDSCWCHVYSTTSSQVFQGWSQEIFFGGRWADIVLTTDGMVVSHPEKPIVPTFYSSSTGGATENNDEIWGGSPLPYLRSVDDHWSLDPDLNPNASWTRTFTPEDVAAKFGFDSIDRIYVSEFTTGRSARTVVIVGNKSGIQETESFSGSTVKSKLGLRSNYFDIDWGGEPLPPPPPPVGDQVVLHDPTTGLWLYRDTEGAISTIYFGDPSDYAFFGDWDCDGVATPGLYRQSDGYVYLRNSNTQGIADITFYFGNPGDVPIAGDFNGDGCDTVSIYRPSEQVFYVINALGENGGGLGAADIWFVFGNPGDSAFVGDWDGDGIDTPGLRRPSNGFVYLKNSNSTGVADINYFFGDPGDLVFAGDWDDDGNDTLGLYRPSNGTVYLRNANSTGVADDSYQMGTSIHKPVAG